MDEITEQLKNYTVLCVEDEDGIRKRLVNTLKYYFAEVYEASNGEEGYYVYYDKRPNIIISDIEMPERNGIQMIEEIRKNDLTTIVIMLTAYSSEEYLLNLINLNINHYILKPVVSDNLLSGIVKAFGNRLQKKVIFSEEMYFDMEKRELYFKNEKILLRKRDKNFLLLLHENKNRVLTYSMIEEYIWKDKLMSMSALKTFIKELRQRLPIELIENVPQEGYKLKLY
ncbi:response regulator receiver protein [Arcobacter nitrofigilis DSM 7299]|uniref:Response regulator receiver protein n=1 Tax=Arcobacter nitrofigilis (strain ATCC 33309 / DSM 7299 / CCUG 15893 / LMG 7604 / NCTC 12251 / CI) TaxID=572480 RepID=D5V4N5_ARCNC|nr:response regulator [Arcobacter nitrofigilis]ADG92940.1 response regulator receiver protein [Arcobacter nitrofigilis DSM 7299]